MSLKILIIGGVAAGPKTAARLRRLMPESQITLIDRDSILSYGACGLPYYVEGTFNNVDELVNTPVGVPKNSVFFDKVKGFTALTRTEALKIDRAAKIVHVKNLDTGDESDLAYDKLVLATGSSAFRPPVNGVDLKNVWFMTHPEHAKTLVEQIKEQGFKKAVMVGAGFIGIEMAEAMIQKGLDVSLIEMADQIMPGLLDKDVAAFAAKHLRQKGVKLVLGERVTSIDGKEKVTSITTDKQTIETDFAVIAVGTRPNDMLAKDSGLECMEKGGILINEYCQTSDPNIYAGGDCTVNQYAGRNAGRPMYAPLGSTANKHGRVIANHIAGNITPFAGVSGTGIVKAFDFKIGRTGLSENQARELNLDIETTTWCGLDKPHYMGASPFIIKMIASRRDRKLLGVQIAGIGDGPKRLDAAAALIFMGATLDDAANVDFGYAPPFSPPIDSLATCAHMLTNKLDGFAKGVGAFEAKERIEKGNVILLDVRTPDEFETMQLPYDAVHIPLGALREKASMLPKDKDILAFCKVSMRGYEAQLILNALGFDRVKFIEGGIVGWPFEVKMLA